MGFQLTYDIWKYQPFKKLFFAGFLTSISRWFEFLTFSIISWELTGNAAIVGYIMTARFVALAITGIFFSVNGRLYSGQKIMILFTGGCGIFCSLVFISFYLNANIQLVGLFIISSLSGSLWSVDFSFRRRMLGDSLPEYLIPTGVSIDVLSTHATRLIGPFLGGIILTYFYSQFIFLFLSFLYFLSTYLIFYEKDHNKNSKKINSYLGSLKDVLFEISKKPNLINVISLTPLFNIFGLPFLSLIGILIIEKFSFNAFDVGLIVSLEGLGALIGGIVISAFPPKNKLVPFCVSLLLLFVFICFISLNNNSLLLIFLLFFAGFVTSTYSALQSSIVYLSTTPKLRSSTFSFLTIAIGSGALGSFNIAFMANFYTTEYLTLIMGLEGIVFFLLLVVSLNMKFKFFRKI